jgi:PAS domain S-box-containing protein
MRLTSAMTSSIFPPAAADPLVAPADWLSLAASAGRVGFWCLDVASRRITCSDMGKANFGLPASAELTLDVLNECIHPDDRADVHARIWRAVEARGDYASEYRVVWPDGSVHWINGRGRVIQSPQGLIMAGVSVDITERKELEQQLLQQWKLNRTITTHVPEGLCFVDAEGKLTFMNPAAEDLLGWKQEEILGRDFHEAVHYKHPDGSPFSLEKCVLAQTVVSGAQVRNREDYFIHRDGHIVPIVCSATPIIQRGVITGAVFSLHDISERKLMENALREASRAKDEFLATVSHELRTPMTSIMGWIGLLKMMSLDTEVRSAVEHIENAAKAQAAIVDDLVDVSRAITGKLGLKFEPVDLLTVIDESIQAIEPSASAKKIALGQKFSGGDSAIVSGDAGRIQQVLWNLLTNAIKFTPENGRVQLTLACLQERVVVEVCDTGIGIAPEFLPFVFDRFTQASSMPSRQYGGLGLGLAIVKQIVELHGGTVAAKSDGPGLGSTFVVTLPRLVTGSR